MTGFRASHNVRFNKTIEPLLGALLDSYREWGGRAQPPTMAIVDWREVPTWTEFEILRDAFVTAGVHTIISDPRDLEFDGTTLTADGHKIDLVYRRVLINDILERPDVRDADTGNANEVFHYVRKNKIAESAVMGTMVEALCGEVFPVTKSPKPGSPVCPACKEVYEQLKK